jgi:hypothetical protein
VRADPVKAGLLYAGTESSVYVSFDDGVHWQSLRNNLPTALVNDLLVHGDDLIAATQGRAIWVLDDVTPLRQHARVGDTSVLFSPANAVRVRGSQGRDTPPPADTALGQNPPTGAVIDYWLPTKARRVVLDIRQGGKLVRHYASDVKEETPEADRYFDEDWLRPPQQLSADAGAHRFVWNLRTARPRAVSFDYGINAVYREGTPVGPQGMLVAPGDYDVALTVDGKTSHATLNVISDPRVAANAQDIPAASAFGREVYAALERNFVGSGELHAVNAQIAKIAKIEKASPSTDLHAAIEKFQDATKALSSGEGDSNENLGSIGEVLGGIANDIEASDRTPTQPQHDLLAAANERLSRALTHWNGIKQADLAQLNMAMKAAGKKPITVPTADKISFDDSAE